MDLKPKNAELIIGIVAPIGVDTKLITKSIKSELLKYKYLVHDIHITDIIRGFKASLPVVERPIEQRYISYIEACNSLRFNIGNNVMAMLAIWQISNIRREENPLQDILVRRAYIVNQIKRPEEFELLRTVYGEHYVQISCHDNRESRIAKLAKRIADDHPDKPKSTQWDIEARGLVNRDESEEEVSHGQRVREVFPLSDVILNATTKSNTNAELSRFLRALFGDNSVTPTREEYGMELANTAAQRSSDLSRQVGAAIVSKAFEIKALGCNEVPKALGGTYWQGDNDDARDFTKGEDTNHKRREAVLIDLLMRLKKIGALKAEYHDSESIKQLLFERKDTIISQAQLMDSLEYGRSVHAEMNAITDAARVGQPIKDCLLFSNTFPCHNCAKHIVASGISEVIYNHPYPKSYVSELFDDSIAINPVTKLEGRVSFRQFIGILGPMYSRVFTKLRWKREDGHIQDFDKNTSSFIRRTPIPAYLETEKHLTLELVGKLRAKGYLSGLTQSSLEL